MAARRRATPAAEKPPAGSGYTLEPHKTGGLAVLKDGEQITRVDTREQGEDYIARMTNQKEA